MEGFIHLSLIIHIVFGSISLLTGLAAILLRNKVKLHRPFGKVYFWCMNVVFITAFYVSIYRGNVFLFFVSVFTYYSAITAWRTLKLKKLHLEQDPHWIDWGIEVVFGLMHLSFIVFGLLLIRNNFSFGTISLVFGLVGLRSNFSTIKRLRKKLQYKNYWLLAHIGGMLGSYIGAFTAFVVNNNRWIGAPDLIMWLGPAILFVPLMIFEIKKHQAKAGKLTVKTDL